VKYTLWQLEIAQVEPTMTTLATGHSRPTRAKSSRAGNPLAHIPGDDGWPIVGNTLTVLRDPVGAVELVLYRTQLTGYVLEPGLIHSHRRRTVAECRARVTSEEEAWVAAIAT
jgi:hypothetical protein